MLKEKDNAMGGQVIIYVEKKRMIRSLFDLS
jgi:hypothetical protein